MNRGSTMARRDPMLAGVCRGLREAFGLTGDDATSAAIGFLDAHGYSVEEESGMLDVDLAGCDCDDIRLRIMKTAQAAVPGGGPISLVMNPGDFALLREHRDQLKMVAIEIGRYRVTYTGYELPYPRRAYWEW